MHKTMAIGLARAVHCRTSGGGGGGGGGGTGPETATCSCTARVLESHLDCFRTSIILNKGRVSAQLFGDISIWLHILYGVHVK